MYAHKAVEQGGSELCGPQTFGFMMQGVSSAIQLERVQITLIFTLFTDCYHLLMTRRGLLVSQGQFLKANQTFIIIIIIITEEKEEEEGEQEEGREEENEEEEEEEENEEEEEEEEEENEEEEEEEEEEGKRNKSDEKREEA